MLKKRNGFTFNNGEQHEKKKNSATGRLKTILRYNTAPTPTVNDTTSKNTNLSSDELPEDILADSVLFEQEKARPVWNRKRFHFIIGLSVGLLAAYGASTTPTAQTHLNELQSYLALQISEMDITKMIPVTDMVDEIFGNVTNFFTPVPSSDQAFMPAMTLKEEMDLKPHHPVVLIPGIISSGLESWGTSEKSRKFFRKRMWGTTTMFRSVLLDKETWTQHLKLDPVTGLDPPDIKIRAAQGLDAADYFVTGYWIWAKIIENLAYIGYDNNNMYLASYDWRLSFTNLETRDKYFTKLQSIIETSKKSSNIPAVIVTHSMGSTMFPYFLRWVQDPRGGNGGDDWTERHIASFVNIAGPMVGVPKCLTAMLSGETRDTMSLGSFGAYLLEKFFSRRERASLMRTWGGGSSMLPKGGDLIWGNRDNAPDDDDNAKSHSYGNIISFTKKKQSTEDESSNTTEKVIDEDVVNNFGVTDALDLLYSTANGEYTEMLASNYSMGFSASKKQLEKNNLDPRKWSNPLESQLPIAPSMKIYCMYGIGLPTERSYYYTRAKDDVQNHNRMMKDGSVGNLDVSMLFNGTDIQQEEFMDAVVKKSLNKEEDTKEDDEVPLPPPMVGILVSGFIQVP
ncbi:unnamed protein product [Mucor hiemalis]